MFFFRCTRVRDGDACHIKLGWYRAGGDKKIASLLFGGCSPARRVGSCQLRDPCVFRRERSPALLYSLVPILLWSALRIGWAGISTSLIIVAFLSIWGAVHGRGPFAVHGPFGNPMWLQLQLFLIFAATPFMVLAAAIEERKAAEKALAGVNRKLIQVQDQERARIARDLHDDLGQRLSLLAIELDVLAHDPGEIPAKVRDGIVHTRDQASVITSDVHTLSHRLHSQKLERFWGGRSHERLLPRLQRSAESGS